MYLVSLGVVSSVWLIASTSTTCSAFQVQLPMGRTTSKVVTPSPSSSLLEASFFVDIDEHAERDFTYLDEWAMNCGVQRVGGFQLASEDGGLDVGVVTSEPIQGGNPVLLVPADAILSANRIQQEFTGAPGVDDATDMLRRFGAGADIPIFYLTLKILYEYEQGDESPYFPWLNALPRQYYNAVSMTDFCLECLPPLVFSLSRVERLKFDNFFQALQKVEFLSAETKENKDLAKWAFNAVTTRSWDAPGDDKQIVPMADMFNHGTDTEIAINYDENGNCIAYATQDIPEGSPLRMSYGCPTNPSRLFAIYGFLDESSPATFCKMMNIQPTPELVNLGFDHSRMLFYKDTGDISEEVWDVTLYNLLGTKNKDAQIAFYEAHMNGDADTKQAIHQAFFLDTATALKTHVDTFLTQLENLQQKGLADYDVEKHPRLPLIMSHNAFVQTTFLRVKENLDPMVAQASEPAYA